jgi:thiol-disulfide isomerase/thioredoxin
MPDWLRRSLVLIMLACSVIIGMRVYIELTANEQPANTGPVLSAPEELPEFVLADIWGDKHSISEWSARPLLINFWATWCAPCRREMPLLQTLHTEQPITGLTIVGIAIDRQPDVQSYIAEAGVSYQILVGEEDAMAASDLFGLEGLGLPFTVLAAADGKILTVYIGELHANQLATMVEISQAYAGKRIDLTKARAELSEL